MQFDIDRVIRFKEVTTITGYARPTISRRSPAGNSRPRSSSVIVPSAGAARPSSALSANARASRSPQPSLKDGQHEQPSLQVLPFRLLGIPRRSDYDSRRGGRVLLPPQQCVAQ